MSGRVVATPDDGGVLLQSGDVYCWITLDDARSLRVSLASGTPWASGRAWLTIGARGGYEVAFGRGGSRPVDVASLDAAIAAPMPSEPDPERPTRRLRWRAGASIGGPLGVEVTGCAARCDVLVTDDDGGCASATPMTPEQWLAFLDECRALVEETTTPGEVFWRERCDPTPWSDLSDGVREACEHAARRIADAVREWEETR